MPGAPPRASTSSPESSAMAAARAALAACRALSSAFSRKLVPVSGGAAMPRSPWAMTSNGKPASNSRSSRSLPGLLEAMTSRSRRARTELRGMQPGDALGDEIQQLVEFMAPKRVAFGSALNLDECAAAVHYHVHIGLRIRILRVVQIEHRRAAVDAHGHGGDLAMQGICVQHAPFQQRVDGVRECHETAGDGHGAGSAVSLQHVAIHGDRTLAQAFQVDHGPKGTADQALNFLRPPGLLAARRLARRPGVRRPRQHAVLGGDPPLILPPQERRHAFLDTGRAQHAGTPEAHQYRAFGVLRKPSHEGEGTQFIWRPTARPYCAHAARQRSAAALVLSLYGAEAATA